MAAPQSRTGGRVVARGGKIACWLLAAHGQEVLGAKGRSCRDGDGRAVQEVSSCDHENTRFPKRIPSGSVNVDVRDAVGWANGVCLQVVPFCPSALIG